MLGVKREEPIGQRIAAARKAAGMSQEQLARALGVSVFTVSRIERDVPKGLSIARLIAIAQVLDVPVSTLLGEDA